MAFFAAQNFIRRYGWPKFQTFVELCNAGAPLFEMSEKIGLSVAQLSRLRSKLFTVRYVPKEGAKRYMEEVAYADKLRYESKSKIIRLYTDEAV